MRKTDTLNPVEFHCAQGHGQAIRHLWYHGQKSGVAWKQRGLRKKHLHGVQAPARHDTGQVFRDGNGLPGAAQGRHGERG